MMPTAGPVACRVLGLVSMDQMTIDLTEALAAEEAAGGRPSDGEVSGWVGTPIEVYGRDAGAGNALPTLAEQAKTHVYELLCRIAPHVPRHYAGLR
jgi:alanine racemase